MSQSDSTAVIGSIVHSGWAFLVTIGVDGKQARVVDRRRLELIPPGVPGYPFHHEGLSLPLPEAVDLVRRVQASVRDCTRTALAELVEHLSTSVNVQAITLVEPREVPPDPAEVLTSRKCIYVADLHMYEVALAEAASALRIPIVSYPRRSELEFAALALRLPTDAIGEYVRGLRTTVGPPWQKDHQAAAATAIGALAQNTSVTLRAHLLGGEP